MLKKDTSLLPLLLVFASLMRLSSCAGNETCPTWLFRSEEDWCSCGSSLVNVVTCNNETGDVGILGSFCLTSYGTRPDQTNPVVGSCLYAQNHGTPTEGGAGLYVTVARNISEQDEQLCGYLNRKGRLCGACKSDYFVSAYSYDLKCYRCRTGLAGNILAYVTVAYVPQTLFLVVVVLFRISFTSPRYTMAILICQIYAIPESQRVIYQYTRNSHFVVPFKLISTLYGIWNLDFFRALIPPICLPLDTVQVIAIDYLTALYPLLLLVCFYALVTAHDRGCWLIMKLWRPFLLRIARTRRQWNVKNSIIDAFAAFILLSFMKFVYTSIDLLISTSVVDMHGSRIGYVHYYDATIDFFGPRHKPYAITAIGVLVLSLLFPLSLLLYPMNRFQRLLNRCRLNSPALRTFMECFQGNYRDRTDGGLDCRYFSAVYPLLRLAGSSIYASTRNNVFFPAISLTFIAITATVVMLRPYKKQYDKYNNLDALLWLSLLGFIAGYMMTAFSFDWYDTGPTIGFVIAGVFGLTPLAYFTVLVYSWIKQYLHTHNICKTVIGSGKLEECSESAVRLLDSTNSSSSS